MLMRSVFISIFLITSLSLTSSAQTVVRVGLFENYPLMYTDDNGKPKGIFVGILEGIAREEGWELEYTATNAANCFEMLDRGEIDILAEIGRSPLRDKKYLLPKESVLSTWARVYSESDTDMSSFFDLENKKVAVLKNSFFITGSQIGFIHTLSQLDVNCTLIEVDSYEEVFELLSRGEVDAGVVNRMFGDINEDKYRVSKTPLVFSPFKLTYALSRKSEVASIVLPALEHHIPKMKEDKASIYHHLVHKYLHGKHGLGFSVPKWFWLVLGGVGIALIQLLIYIQLLKKRVIDKTKGLRKAYDEIKERERILSLIYNNTGDFISLLEVKEDGVYHIDKLPSWFLHELAKENPGVHTYDILGMNLRDACINLLKLSEHDIEKFYNKAQQAVDTCTRVYFEEHIKVPGRGEIIAESNIIPIKVRDEIKHILYVSRDVTSELENKKQLETSELKMRMAVQNVPVMLDAFDEKGNILVWNKKCEEITGYSAEEMIGNPMAMKILYPEDNKRHEMTQNWLDKPLDFDEESVITCKDGTKKTISWIHRAESNPIPGWHDWGIGIDVTAAKQAESDLLSREQQLSTLMRNIPGMVYRLKMDQDFSIEFVSEGVMEMLGMTPEEFIARKLRPKDIIMPQYHDLVRDMALRSVADNVPYEIVIPIKYNDKIIWALDRFRPSKLENGETVLDGLLIDITDKIENEQRLQLAIEGAREGMWDWDITTNKLVFNDYMFQMLGYESGELKHEFNEFLERMHPEDREPTRLVLVNHLKGVSDYYEKEYRIKCKNDGWKWILTRGRVVERDEKGVAQRAIGTHIDIDIRKRAEIALVENERMLSTLMSNLPGMVYQCKNDRNWTMVFVSEGAKKLTGYAPEDIMSGKVVYNSLILDSDSERVWEEVQAALAKNEPFTLTYRIDTPHGVKWIWEQGRAIDNNNTLEGFVTDVTDRVHAEERLVSTIIDTEDNERRRISKELHDNLGQKLTTVSLNLNALKNDVDENHKGWNKLNTGLRHLTQAIKDGREIAHNLMPQSIDDFGYVLSVQSMLADIKSVTPMKFEFYDNLKSQRLDRNMELHLYRITQEAVNNCIKHSEADLVSIQLMKYKNEVVLIVEDDGKGFKFNGQLNGSQSFGLKSIYNRISTLSGSVHIDSTVGKGTTITVELPIKNYSAYEPENINS